jgi:3-methylcrotonyl-CoA carboxylase alpha subunit
MLGSVLIANRGEIACRIARTAKRLGLRTIAVYSEADAGAPHTRLCDEAYLIGQAPARESYLSIERLIEVATRSKAECVHPGYGFLSENPDFAEACERAGIVFVGPPAAAIRAMGLKDHAKALMEKAGVPVVPGYHGERQDVKFLKEKAYEIGYPVLIKPAAGGGGRGLRRVDKHADFEAALESATREAAAAFGISRVLIEKYVTTPRHIEIQVFGDKHGNVIHLNERDCSLQRRHQKVIEESPAPGMTPELRAQMGAAAVAAAQAVGYAGAGTAEFIADGSKGLRADRFWFMEMNTRLQVEHPVTEAITGLDLVEWQFRVASGETLPLKQEQVRMEGHAVEARVYAEDPEHGFLPSTGRIVALALPQDVRVDSGVVAGGIVTPYYDPMIAKLIAHAPARTEALDRLADALGRTLVVGPRSNVTFLAALCRSPEFRTGGVDTGFIDRNLAELGAVPHGLDKAAVALGVVQLLRGDSEALDEDKDETASPWTARDGFQLGPARSSAVSVIADGERIHATVSYGQHGVDVAVDGVAPAADATLFEDGGEIFVLRKGRQTRMRSDDFAQTATAAGGVDGVIRAPMHGKVLALLVEAGEAVTKGQRLAVIEAMKMEHTLTAPCDGIVADIAVHKDSQVVEGAKIMLIGTAPTLK